MNITIDGNSYPVNEGETVLTVARRAGIDIPALCYHDCVLETPPTSCLVCLVKINGRFVPSCATKVADGLAAESETDEVKQLRRTALELLLSEHRGNCGTCTGRKKCKLLQCAAKAKIKIKEWMLEPDGEVLHSSEFDFEQGKCIKCGLCIAVTKKNNEEIGLAFISRGYDVHVDIPFDEPLEKALPKSAAEACGVCPTGALTFFDNR
ncbi:MAG: (2Fe-2S)-binding protein [Planctomycetaceae bacterium]|nr:(2Fe-2S)-binding protein [Planctomycetaceae bacterium]